MAASSDPTPTLSAPDQTTADPPPDVSEAAGNEPADTAAAASDDLGNPTGTHALLELALLNEIDEITASTGPVGTDDVGTDDVGTDDVGTDDVGTDDVGDADFELEVIALTRSRSVLTGDTNMGERSLRRQPLGASQPVAQRRAVRYVDGAQEPQTEEDPGDARLASSDELFTLPVHEPRITSQFGGRRDPINGRQRQHRGTDFGAPTGTPIYATASGAVIMGGWCDRGTGNCIVIDHPYGWRSQYFHLSEVYVHPGEWVEQGQHIGDIGSTGRSTGPHLHFQIGPVGGAAVNPMPLMSQPLDPARQSM